MIKIHDYVIVKNKIGEIIVAGMVKAIKYNYFYYDEKKPFFGISFDNMHFFTEWNNEIYFEENPNHIEKEMNIDGIDVVLWTDITNKPHSSVYRDYDITELDDGVKELVLSLNKMDGITTCSSCSGHKRKHMWIDFCITNLDSLKNIIMIISQKEFRDDWMIINSIFAENFKYNDLIMTLQSKKYSDDKIFDSAQKLSEYINGFVGV